jgi:hypothetical protein
VRRTALAKIKVVPDIPATIIHTQDHHLSGIVIDRISNRGGAPKADYAQVWHHTLAQCAPMGKIGQAQTKLMDSGYESFRDSFACFFSDIRIEVSELIACPARENDFVVQWPILRAN